ncbi:MAG: helix-turn-helix transcriptional regulator, partial [Xanthobacteraceae bacterium]
EKAMPASMIGLTLRETQVLTLIAHGQSGREIGNILGITKRTADAHAQSIIQKLGAANRPQAVGIAIREHIVDMN